MLIRSYPGQIKLLSNLNSSIGNILNKTIQWFDNKLNRKIRSKVDRMIRGGLTSLIIASVCGTIGYCISWLSQNVSFAWVIELIGLIALLNPGGTYKSIRNVAMLLEKKNLIDAQQFILDSLAEEPEQIDSHSIARISITYLATYLTERIIAPCFWYILFGFPGITIYLSIILLNQKIGHETKQHRDFGIVAINIKNILLFLPAHLSTIFVILASFFVPTAHPTKGLKTMLKGSNKYQNRSMDVPLLAFAGTLDLALAGPLKFIKNKRKQPWIGTGIAQATHLDIQRGMYLYAVTNIINGIWIVAILIAT